MIFVSTPIPSGTKLLASAKGGKIRSKTPAICKMELKIKRPTKKGTTYRIQGRIQAPNLNLAFLLISLNPFSFINHPTQITEINPKIGRAKLAISLSILSRSINRSPIPPSTNPFKRNGKPSNHKISPVQKAER